MLCDTQTKLIHKTIRRATTGAASLLGKNLEATQKTTIEYSRVGKQRPAT